MPTEAPTRRAKRRDQTLDEIRNLALEQLATVGPSGLNLRAIARDMGMSSAGIYRYFESRDDLLVSLIADGFDSLGEALRSTLEVADGSAPDRLAEALRAYRRWARDQPQRPADLPPQFAASVLQVWSSVHGFVSLEVFHHFDWADLDLDAAFEEQVTATIRRLE